MIADFDFSIFCSPAWPGSATCILRPLALRQRPPQQLFLLSTFHFPFLQEWAFPSTLKKMLFIYLFERKRAREGEKAQREKEKQPP